MGMACWIAYTTFVAPAEMEVPVGRLISAASLLNENDQLMLYEAVKGMLENK